MSDPVSLYPFIVSLTQNQILRLGSFARLADDSGAKLAMLADNAKHETLE